MTGGAGFIGSHLTRTLLGEGGEVVIVDNLSTGDLRNLPKNSRLSLIKKDISRCRPSDFKGRFDSVIHLAALPSVPMSWREALRAHESNATATLAILELSAKLKIERFLYASSAAVYGPAGPKQVSEETALNAFSPYGLQKIASEKYIQLYARRYSFTAVILRLFNVFGCTASGAGPGFVSIAQKAISRRQPVLLYGDGKQTRDFIYVRDVVSAFQKASQLKLSPGNAKICNVASGHSITLLHLIKTLERLEGSKALIRYQSAQPGDIRNSEADVRRASKLLGFRCRYSLEEGLRDMQKICR